MKKVQMKKLHLALGLLSMSWASSALSATLIDLKPGASNQLVLQFTEPSHYKTFVLHSPERLVFDFDHTNLQKALSTVSLQGLPVYRIRTSVNANKTLRVVLDLKNTDKVLVNAKPEGANQPWELVLDFNQPVSSVANKSVPVAPQPQLQSKPVNFVAPTAVAAPIVTGTAAASTTTNNTGNSSFSDNKILSPTSGRAQVSAAGVTNSLGVFGGDVMVPVYGQQNEFVFGDLMGDYGTDSTYLVSPGVGYRKVVNNQIFGGYFFGDYEQTSLGANFWNLSPGVEWITPQWDAHLNGYFPTSTSQESGDAYFANTQGDYSQVNFETGTHNQYDELLAPYAVIGDGVDAEVAYSFDINDNKLRSRVYLGGYYYQASSDTNSDISNITGVTLGLSQAVSKSMTIALYNSYDEVSNYNVGVSLTMTLGGESNLYSDNVQDRLLDPVQRHVGIIDTGAGNYDQQDTESLGNALEYDNVYFASETGTGNGTYGSPMALNQDNLDLANAQNPDSSRIYLQGDSTYEVNASTATNTGSELDAEGDLGLYVYNGQDFYGRTTDYTAPAASGDEPLIHVDGLLNYNGFIIHGGENTFSDIDMYSTNDASGTGIIAYNTSGNEELNIYNTDIELFANGVIVNNSSSGVVTVNTDSSSFDHSYARGVHASATGMTLNNTGSGDLILNATNSTFSDNAAEGYEASAYGLSAQNMGTGSLTVNATNSSFNGNRADGNTAQAFGINFLNGNTGNLMFTAENSQFNTNTVTGTDAIAAGLYIQNNSSGIVEVDLVNSQFNSNTSSTFDAFGIEAVNHGSGTLVIDVSNSQFNGNTGAVFAAGFYGTNLGSGNLSINTVDSLFNNNTGSVGYGFYTVNASTVTNTNATFTGNTTGGSN